MSILGRFQGKIVHRFLFGKHTVTTNFTNNSNTETNTAHSSVFVVDTFEIQTRTTLSLTSVQTRDTYPQRLKKLVKTDSAISIFVKPLKEFLDNLHTGNQCIAIRINPYSKKVT